MMPMSHRIGTTFDAPAATPAMARIAAPVRAANSATLVIAVATTFALLSALVSLLPDTAVPDDLARAHLRGSLAAVGEPAVP